MHKNVKKKINTPITHHLEITTVYIYKHFILFFFKGDSFIYTWFYMFSLHNI